MIILCVPLPLHKNIAGTDEFDGMECLSDEAAFAKCLSNEAAFTESLSNGVVVDYISTSLQKQNKNFS